MRVAVFLVLLAMPTVALAQSAPWPEALCQRGEPWACVESGTRLAKQSADREAMEHFWRACEADEPDGCSRVGQMLKAGRDGGFDFAAARTRLTAACDTAQPRACLALGHLHTLGAGGPAAHDVARTLYTAACARDPWTCSGLGWQLELGLGVTRDAAGAIKHYKKACAAKNLHGGCRMVAELGGDKAARPVRDRACKAGEPIACFRLGRHDRACTLGVSASCREQARATLARGDAAAAERLYGLACGVGDPAACGELGLLRLQAGDAATATQYLEYGCAAKDPPSCLNLGLMLALGHGVTADPARGVAALRQACDGGLAEACGQLGVAVVKGLGGKADPAAGLALIQQACDAGRAASCGDLGILYHQGTGVTADPAKARAAFDRGCAGGHADSCASARTLAEAATPTKPTAPAGRPKDIFTLEAEAKAEAKQLEATCDKTGDGAACFRAAMRLRRITFARSPDREQRLFAKGCQLGHGESCAETGEATSLKRGCDLGAGKACVALARQTAKTDRAGAQALNLRGCELGAGAGCLMAGGAAHGAGRRDEAIRLYRKACELNDPVGCAFLAEQLEKDGDLTEARRLFRTSCDAGYDSACRALKRLE